MYLYIIREREFINTNENIYKFNYTDKNINLFMSKIPKNSNIFLFTYINDDDINIYSIIINKFKKYFNQRTDINESYFEGDISLMIEIINYYLYNSVYNKYKNIIKDNIYWWDD